VTHLPSLQYSSLSTDLTGLKCHIIFRIHDITIYIYLQIIPFLSSRDDLFNQKNGWQRRKYRYPCRIKYSSFTSWHDSSGLGAICRGLLQGLKFVTPTKYLDLVLADKLHTTGVLLKAGLIFATSTLSLLSPFVPARPSAFGLLLFFGIAFLFIFSMPGWTL